MRKKTKEIKLESTGLVVNIQGAGSISGILYGPLDGYYNDGRYNVRAYIKTTAHLPLGDVQNNEIAQYKIHFIAANFTVTPVQIGRHRDTDLYYAAISLSEEEMQRINFSIEYHKERTFLLT